MSEHWSNGVATLHQADAREMPLQDASVHMCVTSPPYWGLRDYGLEAGIGLESTLGEWVANIVAAMREVWRVLRDDGTCWLNLGDAYVAGQGINKDGTARLPKVPTTTSSPGPHAKGNPDEPSSWTTRKANQSIRPVRGNKEGLKPKDIMGQPWRVAFALQDDGWLLRSAIVWHKPNPMPESVRDRPTNAYEMVFLLSKQGRYFYDAEAIRQPSAPSVVRRDGLKAGGTKRPPERNDAAFRATVMIDASIGANARNVWSIPTQGRPDAHFATFPDELPRRCILAGTSERGVCADCGAPWTRIVQKNDAHHDADAGTKYDLQSNAGRIAKLRDSAKARGADYHQQTQTLGWQPTCGCNADTVPATVLDPFAGSGTTLAVAQALGRKAVGLDLNPEYLGIAQRYINRADGITLPMALV